MWICLSDAFLSVVALRPDSPQFETSLLVRARRPGDIERVFGADTAVEQTPGRDYLFRAILPREQVAAAIAGHLTGIRYGNFKNSVDDRWLHRAYNSFWHDHASLQPVPPYSTGRSRGAK